MNDLWHYSELALYAVSVVAAYIAGHRQQFAQLTAAAEALGADALKVLADIKAHAKGNK